MNLDNRRVAFVVGKCCPGGVVSYSSEYARFLTCHGFAIDFLIEQQPEQSWIHLIENHANQIIEIPSIRFPYRCWSEIKSVFSHNRYTIAHSFLNTLNFIPMGAAKQTGIPIRVAENLSTGSKYEVKSIVKEALKPLGGYGATHICANSHTAAEWLYGPRRAKQCFIAPNPIDANIFFFDPEVREETRKTLGLANSLCVASIARYETQKNILFLIDVFRELCKLVPTAKLLLLGHGSLENVIREKVSTYKIDDRVLFLDPSMNRNAVYNAADVFVLPSLYEGMPIAALEAQATGLRCLLSDSITQECNIDEACRYVALSENATKWAEHILEISQHEERPHASRVFSETRFETNRAGTALMNYYFELIDECA